MDSKTEVKNGSEHHLETSQSEQLDVERQASSIASDQSSDHDIRHMDSHVSNTDMPVVNPYKEQGDEIYNRFSNHKKHIMVIVLSFCGFLAPISSTTILSAVPEVAQTYNTSGDIINISNALYLVFMGLSRE
jgi:hypothetical protein